MTKLNISLQDGNNGRQSWVEAAGRLGVTVVPVRAGPHVLPLSNQTALAASRVAGVAFMSAKAFDISSDSMARPGYFPALPCAQDMDAVRAMTGPVFVKPRFNLMKSLDPQAYTRWASGADIGELSDGLVVTPDAGNPATVREVDFAVNQKGEVFVMRCWSHTFTDHNRPGDMVSGVQAPAALMGSIDAFCKAHGVTGGIYNIQAVKHADQWVVMDWNARPSGAYQILAAHPGMAEPGLAHMLGMGTPSVPPVHAEIRSYWHSPIPNVHADLVRAAGLTPSWVWERRFIGRVYGIGIDPQDVAARFDHLQQLLKDQ